MCLCVSILGSLSGGGSGGVGGLNAQSAAVVKALRDEMRSLGRQIGAVDDRIAELEDTVNDSGRGL